jgi:hypothetical protein
MSRALAQGDCSKPLLLWLLLWSVWRALTHLPTDPWSMSSTGYTLCVWHGLKVGSLTHLHRRSGMRSVSPVRQWHTINVHACSIQQLTSDRGLGEPDRCKTAQTAFGRFTTVVNFHELEMSQACCLIYLQTSSGLVAEPNCGSAGCGALFAGLRNLCGVCGRVFIS